MVYRYTHIASADDTIYYNNIFLKSKQSITVYYLLSIEYQRKKGVNILKANNAEMIINGHELPSTVSTSVEIKSKHLTTSDTFCVREK